MTEGTDFDLIVGEKDAQGQIVITIYAQKDSRYCVYATRERVKICFADDSELQRLQRRRLLPISSLRSQISGLLEGSSETAVRTLTRIRDDLLAERHSRGRLTYLRVAAAPAPAVTQRMETQAVGEAVKPLPDDPDGADVPSSPTANDTLDCCDTGHDGTIPLTPDEELPAASGGVATN